MNSEQQLFKKTDDLLVKIRRLAEKHEKLIEELKARNEKIDSQRKQLTTCEERNELLEKEIASLKLGAFVESSDENKKEVKRKLSEYIRQLDGAITKLSGED